MTLLDFLAMEPAVTFLDFLACAGMAVAICAVTIVLIELGWIPDRDANDDGSN